MDHPALFGPHFAGPTWDAWRAFLAASAALPMTEAQSETYRQCTGRTDPPVRPFREATLIIGRRGGKSRVLALIAVYLACFIDHRPHLAAGEVATVAAIAADRRQARTVLRYVLGLLRAVPALASRIENETAESVTLAGSVQIEVTTANFRVTRGYSFAAVLADEAAFWPTDDSANPDVEIIRAVRPGLATLPHSLLLVASSPYAKRGVLWQAFRQHFGKNDARVLVWRAPSLTMNPSLDPALVAQAREDDPEAARAEYDAEFRDDVAQFVPRDVIDSCTVPGRRELLPVSTLSYCAAIDPSGGSSDSMTLAVAHAEAGHAVLDCIREVRPPFSPEAVVADFAALLKGYRVRAVVGDRYGGEWCREPFRSQGIQYDLAQFSASEIFRDALPLFTSGAAQLLDLPRLATQLAALERRTSRAGRDLISHPPGGHDDVAVVACSALLLCRNARAPMRISPEALALVDRFQPRSVFVK